MALFAFAHGLVALAGVYGASFVAPNLQIPVAAYFIVQAIYFSGIRR